MFYFIQELIIKRINLHVTNLTVSQSFIENLPLFGRFCKNWYLKQTILNKFIHINVKTHFSNAPFHYYTEYKYLLFDGMTKTALDLP